MQAAIFSPAAKVELSRFAAVHPEKDLPGYPSHQN
jgi:hypothetical protein